MKEIFRNKIFRFILSSPASKQGEFRKIDGKLLLKNGEEVFFLEQFSPKNQAFHRHLKVEELEKFITDNFGGNFRQLELYDAEFQHSFRAAKKRTLYNKHRHNENFAVKSAQNREKNYILKEGMAIEPLIELGIFSRDLKIIKAKSDKYRQINRFIEFIADATASYQVGDRIRVIDFGCGKSYLTFIVYYYLTFIKKLDAEILGLDLKADVINKCNLLAQKFNYKKLKFQLGDIGKFTDGDGVDMVITLHACDVATDYALFNAVKWQSRIILSVPCCQHELNSQFDCTEFPMLQRYGIIKERLSAILTDNIRAELLRSEGYKTDLLEFVDLSHTPKNILIRAIKSNALDDKKRQEILTEVAKLQEKFNFKQKLYSLLNPAL
ncbi:MAG: SAM-dependent methyltransferase [Lentisphaeria bacterium]|nr:SAM-dependent methyltransferase [Lentisphaeria bacterium]